MSMITNNEELEALAQRLFPKFNEFLMRNSKNIFSCELATSLDGILTMPALYDKDGVRKQVIAPLKLLTKDVDAQIEVCKKATADCIDATSSANTAATTANDAAKKATDATAELDTKKKEVNAAVDACKTATDAANTATETSKGQTAACKEQTDIAKDVNDHPNIMGDNGNWWKWNTTAQQYEDTGIIARGGMMYPSFRHRRNKLLMLDYGSHIGERLARKRNKLLVKL